ncbi:hypothetical protein [Natronococcus sp. A-GB7]|jgi:hypothetical protein|uniref:hypothetical protein n=1 Tax=Natronococcus sp. A-GB7 TaxID=3037649 RepID=UPI00241D1150|nr:hypothetical protein [Natronococcus sp. A-GB7]MDG5819818.1 hypothetical protein [Natronococcus sp. A-GB7]
MASTERLCHAGIFVSLVLLSVGVGIDVLIGTSLLDFLIVVAGLVVGWTSFLYCLGRSPVWNE